MNSGRSKRERLKTTHGPTTIATATAPAPSHFHRHFHGVRASAGFVTSSNGTKRKTPSNASSERDSVASALPTATQTAFQIDGRCQNRYAIHTVSVTVKIAIDSLWRKPSCENTLG